ncbi:DUF1206 domain-containing protein [Nocardioides sp. zg-DK7169]|uniref:DUF1206 domain-containing protein n=1 Tax=Nocardioides sp. zg-DK7169 TaxID=2736600 RepID=UPI001552DE4A|nr:DUF1206 domain-containing protein [Nocardioides sp. zg-DK7169]NPC95176.1 DUF1206 domain-containing protein [Nocardioides sp. zg-DK7169]
MTRITDRAEQIGERAHGSDWLDHAVRAGLVAYGLVHLMIGWLALQLAFGDREGETSTTGALQELAQQPFGSVLVWLVALGLALLVVWRLLEAFAGHQDEDDDDRWKKQASSVLKAVVYAALSISAIRVATSSGDSGGGKGGGKGSGGSGGETTTLTAEVMSWPGGQLLIGAVGLAIIGYGLHHLWRAWTDDYREELDAEGRSGDTGTAYLWFGKIGYAAKGLAVGLVGALFVYAAATHDAGRTGGLDEALREVLDQPFGQFLLGVIGVGIGCYGLFAFARARHLSR